MTRIELNKETRLFEIIEIKTGNVLARSTGHEAAIRIMDRWDEKLNNKEETK